MGEIDNKAEKRKDADIMKKYKAVFSDIDGTLLNSKHQIPENTRKKIKQINQNGIPIFFFIFYQPFIVCVNVNRNLWIQFIDSSA